MIDRFGAQAVYGRTLGIGEIRRIVAAENVVKAYRAYKAAANGAKWAEENPQMWSLIEYGASLNKGQHG